MLFDPELSPAKIQERGLRGLNKDDREAANTANTVEVVAEKIGGGIGAVVAGRTFDQYNIAGQVPAPWAGAAIAILLDFTGWGGDGPVITGCKEAAYTGAFVDVGIRQAIAAGRVAKI